MQQFFNIKSKKVLQMGASVFADIKMLYISNVCVIII